MQNDAGENVDLSASNRIIHAKDHASIQINVADVDEKTGIALPTFKTYAICGSIRRMGESDDCINRLAKKDGVLAKNCHPNCHVKIAVVRDLYIFSSASLLLHTVIVKQMGSYKTEKELPYRRRETTLNRIECNRLRQHYGHVKITRRSVKTKPVYRPKVDEQTQQILSLSRNQQEPSSADELGWQKKKWDKTRREDMALGVVSGCDALHTP
ncbi:hypothetical protein OUZ56_008169 [Daphnia magna]|uniref:40S ribosomal protein S21 n=1 Tax=Daphnia magna TaxID=35525 RepID=A0ABR0ACB3_9CRUS|nr:hypothetical protein OUZ56_008169 [Daphnia magna]